LNNVSKHAQAQHVDIRLAYADELLELTIKDDGSGFDINLVKAGENRAKGIGLVGIHERLALLGGTFEVKSQLGQGTILRANIPWKSES
jgi:signal transduction histidine kinase